MEHGRDAVGETHELGVIRLQDDCRQLGRPRRASIARERLREVDAAARQAGRTPSAPSAAPGGRSPRCTRCCATIRCTWSSTTWPTPPTSLKLCDEIVEAVGAGKAYAGQRARQLVAARPRALRRGGARRSAAGRASSSSVVFSALGVREGYLYGLLDAGGAGGRSAAAGGRGNVGPALALAGPCRSTSSISPPISSTPSASPRRPKKSGCARSPATSPTSAGAATRTIAASRASTSIAYGSLTGVDHPGRAFLAEVLAVRYMGLKHKSVSQALLELAGDGGQHAGRG